MKKLVEIKRGEFELVPDGSKLISSKKTWIETGDNNGYWIIYDLWEIDFDEKES